MGHLYARWTDHLLGNDNKIQKSHLRLGRMLLTAHLLSWMMFGEIHLHTVNTKIFEKVAPYNVLFHFQAVVERQALGSRIYMGSQLSKNDNFAPWMSIEYWVYRTSGKYCNFHIIILVQHTNSRLRAHHFSKGLVLSTTSIEREG